MRVIVMNALHLDLSLRSESELEPGYEHGWVRQNNTKHKAHNPCIHSFIKSNPNPNNILLFSIVRNKLSIKLSTNCGIGTIVVEGEQHSTSTYQKVDPDQQNLQRQKNGAHRSIDGLCHGYLSSLSLSLFKPRGTKIGSGNGQIERGLQDVLLLLWHYYYFYVDGRLNAEIKIRRTLYQYDPERMSKVGVISTRSSIQKTVAATMSQHDAFPLKLLVYTLYLLSIKKKIFEMVAVKSTRLNDLPYLWVLCC
jgi:hypothetical protein